MGREARADQQVRAAQVERRDAPAGCGDSTAVSDVGVEPPAPLMLKLGGGSSRSPGSAALPGEMSL